MRDAITKKRLGFTLAAACLIAGPPASAETYFDASTGILHIPYGTIVSGGSTSSFTDIQMKLNSVQIVDFDFVSQFVSDEVAQGALAYSKYWETAAGGDGNEPDHADYTRCKACHGWDLLGTSGGYVRRSDGGGTRSAAVNIRLDRTDYTADQIRNAGGWVPGTDDPQQSHPDFSGILSDDQVNALVAYLNFRDGKFDTIGSIYTAPNPAEYTVRFGDAARGETFYTGKGSCQGCHGDADDENASVPEGGVLAYFQGDGKPSELAHKVRWGEVGSIMTRQSMGNPTSQDIADLIAYLQSLE